MTLGTTLYQGNHRTQFDGGALQSSNCVPASLRDAAEAVSAGNVIRSPSQVRALLKISEETNPATPGWSIADADKAASRLGITFTPAAGPWSSLRALRSQGRFIILQGDSDVFTDGCSGSFDGPHCIALPPLDHSDGRWRIGDPLCRDWRWETEAKIKSYAGRLAGVGNAWYGYTDAVPNVLPDTSTGDEMTVVTPVTITTGHVTSSGPVTIYTPDGSVKRTETLTAVKADVTEYAINQSDGRAPKGGPWRRLAERPFAGYYVPSASVKWTPPPPAVTDVKHDVGLTKDGVAVFEMEV